MQSSKWQGSMEISVSAPLEGVWKIMSDYYELQKWFPGMVTCKRVDGAPEQGLGCVRYCTGPSPSNPQGSDSFAQEELVAFDSVNHSFTYLVTDTNIPGFHGYQATFQVSETGEEGKTLVNWHFELDPVAGLTKEGVQSFLSSILTGMAKNLEQLSSSQ
ncbi:hypothetical protein SUGI_0592800 [Cryptomeria japonica]|nr:hypothetical protein SUGI_0592800 [Cryptomeria japonica]